MRIGAQRIEDETFDSFEQCKTTFWNVTHVSAIGNIANAKSEHVKTRPVLARNWNHAGTEDIERLLTIETGQVHRRSGARVRRFPVGEGVVERFSETQFDFVVAVDRHRMSKVKLKQPQIVKAHHVIRVLMGVNHRMNNPDLLANQLVVEVGRGIDKQVALGEPKNRAATCSLVPRMVALAGITTTTDCRHADRCPGPEQNEFALNVSCQWSSCHGQSVQSKASLGRYPRGSALI